MIINEKLIGKEAYAVANPQGNYSTTKYVDIWYYPAEPQSNTRSSKVAGEPVPQAELPEDW